MQGRTFDTRRLTRVMTGISGTAVILLMQALLYSGTLWDGVSRASRIPDAVGTAANVGDSEGRSTERLITVRLISDISPQSSQLAPDFQLAELVRQSLIQVTGPDSLPLPALHFEDEGSPSERSDAELIARAKMVGTYESQIRARIERAWIPPDENPSEPSFECAVLISQDPDGRVREVEMPYECGGSAPMRESLIKAIYTASPLPAPPHPSVFVDRFSLKFRSKSVYRP